MSIKQGSQRNLWVEAEAARRRIGHNGSIQFYCISGKVFSKGPSGVPRYRCCLRDFLQGQERGEELKFDRPTEMEQLGLMRAICEEHGQLVLEVARVLPDGRQAVYTVLTYVDPFRGDEVYHQLEQYLQTNDKRGWERCLLRSDPCLVRCLTRLTQEFADLYPV